MPDFTNRPVVNMSKSEIFIGSRIYHKNYPNENYGTIINIGKEPFDNSIIHVLYVDISEFMIEPVRTINYIVYSDLLKDYIALRDYI